MRHSRLLCLIALCAISGTAPAQTTVPNTFTSGTPARSSEVNANFQALTTAIDALADRVERLEGEVSTTDIAGTYATNIFQIGVDIPSGSTEGITYQGPMILAADGTFSITFTGAKNDDAGPGADNGSLTGTWTLTGSTVTLTSAEMSEGPVVLHSVAGSRLLIGMFFGSNAIDYGHNNIIVLVRAD
jgi:hypothetical protein